ncbi:MAG TPA: bifunctional diguanylate cyclase/phosphodiesterase [Acidimicrobiales bacterium]
MPVGRKRNQENTVDLPTDAPALEVFDATAADSSPSFETPDGTSAGRDNQPEQVLYSRLFILALNVVAIGLLLFAAVGRGDASVGPAYLLVPFVLFQALGWAAAYLLQPPDSTCVEMFDDAVFVAAVLLLPPAGVVITLGLGTVIGLVVLRTKPRAVFLNGGVMTLASLAGIVVAHSIAPDVQSAHPLVLLVSVTAGTLTLAVVNVIVLTGYFRIVLGDPYVSTVVELLPTRVRRTPFLVPIGFLAGVAGLWSPCAALLGVPVLIGLQIFLGQHTRATRDRERTQGLFEASVEIHSFVESSGVAHALTTTTARLLRCETARIDVEAPGESEWGAPITRSDDRHEWLVVSNPVSHLALDAEALGLLNALAAVGSSALQNADLVDEIRRAGLVDALTGLPNHVLFTDRVAQAATAARRNRERFAVMVLDLDAFKKVNDSLGHSHGNELLKIMSERLVAAARDIDTVARLGSDHFTVLLPGVGNAETCGVIAEKLLDAVRRPIELGGHELFMTASAGISFFPEDGVKPEHLLRNADSAMHRAKDMGRNTYRAYASGMNDLAQLRLVRESELHNAVRRDELRLRYQPQIDLRSGHIVGVEALVRWEHPLLGLIGPNEFVPLAEESGLIIEVDTWVLYEACRQARAWLDSDLPQVRMAVNISGRHFHSSDRLVDVVERALGVTGLPAEMLELEVTEGIAVGEEEVTVQALNQIRDLGVKLAIDDFGTGYSMLGRLRQYPIDRLKIDRSFVNEIEGHNAEAPIVSAMIAMARSLRLECVAEGVETLEQQIFLRNHGCDQAQGFLYSHPVEADDIGRLLRTPSVGYNLTAVS